MEYRLMDRRAGPLSQRFVQSYYLLANHGKEDMYCCVPNGELGISIILQGSAHIHTDGGWVAQPPVSIYGLVKRAQFHRMSQGYREFNIGFKPQHLQLFLKDSMSCLLERNATDLHHLFDRSEVQRLFELALTAGSDDDLLRATESFLTRHFQEHKLDPRVIHACELISGQRHTRVDNISADVNLSSAMLRQLFKDRVGLSPKELQRILRIRRALDARERDEDSLTGMSYALGYYDQSHFIHDFKDAVGLSPGQYFRNAALVSDFYNYGRWSAGSFAAHERPL
jgi:AraC-like DNA-binding protein